MGKSFFLQLRLLPPRYSVGARGSQSLTLSLSPRSCWPHSLLLHLPTLSDTHFPPDADTDRSTSSDAGSSSSSNPNSGRITRAAAAAAACPVYSPPQCQKVSCCCCSQSLGLFWLQSLSAESLSQDGRTAPEHSQPASQAERRSLSKSEVNRKSLETC